MTVRRNCQAWLKASLHIATLAGLLLIAACWFTAALVSSVEREKTIEGMTKQAGGTVRLFEQSTVDIIERLDRTLLLLRKSYEDDPAHFDLRSWAARSDLVAKETVQITLVGADGLKMSTTGDDRRPPVYLGDRDYFTRQMDLSSDQLFISEPVLGRISGKVTLQLSRRVHSPKGEFAGVFVLSIDPNFIARFYHAVDLGEKATLVLRNPSGVVLAAQGLSGDSLGRKSANQTFLDALARSPAGNYWGTGDVDGTIRLVAYRSSDRFPLIFSVGLAESDGLSGYLKHRASYFLTAAIITVIVLIAMIFNIRHQAQLDESQARLRLLNQKISRQNVHFDAALANMSNGLSMFDADGQLVVWNERYLELYGLPSELVRLGVSIHGIVEFRRQIGDLDLDVDAFVQGVRRDLADQGRTATTSRGKGGRVISVVNTAIAGGGWVGIHEDVTERTEQESSILEQAAELARVNMRFDAALNNMTQGLCLFDANRNLVIANRRFREMYDYPEQLLAPGTHLSKMLRHLAGLGMESEMSLEQHLERIPTDVDQNFQTLDGRVISIKRSPTEDGGWVATHEDITRRKQSEDLISEKTAELQRINMQFDVALSNMSQGISMFDCDKRLVVWNDRYRELYNLPDSILKRGTHVDDLMVELVARNIIKGEGDRKIVKDAVSEIMNAFPTQSQSDRIEEFADGRLILISRQPMQEGGWVATHEDITERKRAEADIAHMARHDTLTGLANRAEFNARLDEACKRMRRSGPLTVLMLDLDKFKAVNDTLGHPAGDELLIQVGRRLQTALRDTDLLARLGGDEFAIIQEGGTNQQDGAIALAQRIIALIAEPFDLGGHPANIGTSVGIAMAPDHGSNPEQLTTAADLALYDAKTGGRNDFRLFRANMLEAARTRKAAENELRDAIERQQFELHYQPVVDVKRHLLCGAEALVRWRHPSRGLVAPDQFIPLAEATGLIVPLGQWIAEQACADAALLPDHVKLAINVSAVQFRKGDLFGVISRALSVTGLAPQRIELEITETARLENQEAHLETMRKLKQLGIAMVLDDFGTGYSSINYLTSFPFDKIKIDRSFTQGVLHRSDCAAVVASALALAKGLGIVTTAEGVETERQLDYMRHAGVDQVQGYLFGRPVAISEFGTQTAVTLDMLFRIAARQDVRLRKPAGSKRRA